MRDNFKIILGRFAGAGLVATAFAFAGGARAQDLPVPPKGLNCADLADIRVKQGPVHIYTRQLFSKAGISLQQPKINGEELVVCLNSVQERGNMGRYVADQDAEYIDVSKKSSEIDRVSTLVHETRHRYQRIAGLDPYQRGINVHEWERGVLRFIVEADAHSAEVLFADHKRSQGDASYVDAMMKGPFVNLMSAFDKGLRDSGGDRRAAMRATFVEFLSFDQLMTTYFKNSQEIIEQPRYKELRFDPKMQRETMLGAARLLELGRHAGAGNYMDVELIAAIRGLNLQWVKQDQLRQSPKLKR